MRLSKLSLVQLLTRSATRSIRTALLNVDGDGHVFLEYLFKTASLANLARHSNVGSLFPKTALATTTAELDLASFGDVCADGVSCCPLDVEETMVKIGDSCSDPYVVKSSPPDWRALPGAGWVALFNRFRPVDAFWANDFRQIPSEAFLTIFAKFPAAVRPLDIGFARHMRLVKYRVLKAKVAKTRYNSDYSRFDMVDIESDDEGFVKGPENLHALQLLNSHFGVGSADSFDDDHFYDY